MPQVPASKILLCASVLLLGACTEAETESARPGNGNGRPTLEMSVEPAVVLANGSATVTWKARGVRICTASGDWSGEQQKSGSRTFDNITAARTWELTCNGKGSEVSRSVAVAVDGGNHPPVADAGRDQRVSTGDLVVLDAGASSDADGDTLHYAWSVLSRPAGSSAILFDAATRNPRIVVDVAGSFVISLVVNDGVADSVADSVEIIASNSSPVNTAPVADAGEDRSVSTGDRVELDGGTSFDADGDPLGYAWSLDQRPAGSSAALDDAASANAGFTADVDGVYRLSLVVDDGVGGSGIDTLQVTASSPPPGNTAPVAVAGADRGVDTGAAVALDGSGSFDADADPLSYAWTLAERPPGSNAVLDDASVVDPVFTADVDGSYRLSLVVNDGSVDSSADVVVVTASTPPPPPAVYPRQLVPVAYDCADSNVHCVDDSAGALQEFSDIQQAVDLAGPGDRVIVHAGNYSGFRVSNGGTAGNEILITGNGNAANVIGPGARTEGDGIYVANADYVIIEGFNVSGASDNGIATHDASANSPMRGVQIRYNTVSASGWVNIYLSNATESLVLGNTTRFSVNSHGIYISNAGSDDVGVIGNLIHDNNTAGIHFNGDSSVGGDGVISGAWVEGNTAFGNGANGFNGDGLRDSTFVNNLVYANGNHGIRAYRVDATQGPANLSFINNTVIDNGGSAIKLTADGGGNLFFNNILMNNGAGCIYVESSNIVSDHNLYSSGCAFTPNNSSLFFGAASQSSSQSAVFADPAGEDYSLRSDSPAIDSGATVLDARDAPDVDITAIARDASPDIGAYEF